MLSEEERQRHRERLSIWYEEDKKQNLRYSYDLSDESKVIDLGAYVGKWARELYRRYRCHIYCFEPVVEIFNELKSSVSGNSKIKVFNFGVEGTNCEKTIYLDKDGSSFVSQTETPRKVQVRSIVDVLDDLGLHDIDLMKMNIENSEFELLETLIASGRLADSRYYQIQFHRGVPDFEQRRNKIREELSKTHRQMWNHEFIWESWERK